MNNEHKLAGEALRLFKELVEHSTDAIGMSTPEGKHYYQNETFNNLLGAASSLRPWT